MIEVIEDPKAKKVLQVKLDDEWHRMLKIEAAKRRTSMRALLIEAVKQLVGRPE